MSKERNGQFRRPGSGNSRPRFNQPVRNDGAPASKEIVVNVSNRETRMALMEDGKLMEYRVEREERVVGSIYKGIVQNVLPGMDAAFVDIGLERNAYLSVADLLPDEGEKDHSPAGTRRNEMRHRKIKELLRPGQQIMVQVTKGPRGTKGARVSSRIALPGRYVVLMPEGSSVGVSRKLDDRGERDRLKRIGDRIRPEGFGLIMRTECEGRTEAELGADVAYLRKMWADVMETSKRNQAPACVHKDQSLLFRTVRDMFGENIGRMVVDDPDEYEKVHLVAAQVAPHLRDKIDLYDRDEPIFDRYGIEKDLDKLLQHKVPLKSGGSLVIDEMEALVAIDVNTGKHTSGATLADTILAANLEAADEILRQLRLRDMGGIIVCDFIDMESESDRNRVQDHFSAGLARDRARTRVGKISSLGLLELTRKRTGESVTQEITEICPMCAGVGRIASKETVSLWIERDMWRKVQEPGNAFLVECHPAVVEALIGLDGENVENLEQEMRRGIYIRADFDLEHEEYEITSGTIEEFDRKAMGYRRAQVLEANVRRSAYESAGKTIAWTDGGYYVEIMDGESLVGHRAKVVLQELRRSFAVGDVITTGR